MSVQTGVKKATNFRSMAVTLTIAFLALSLIILLISSGLQAYFSFQDRQNIIAEQQYFIAREAASEVTDFIEEKTDTLKIASRLSDMITSDKEEQKLLLSKLLGIEPAFRQVALLNARGQELETASRLSNLESGQLIKRAGSDLFSQANLGKTYISPVYINEVTSEPMIVMAVPVTDVFGDSKGVLMAEVNLKFMWDLVDKIKVGSSGKAYVVDRKGNLLAYSDISRVLKGENLSRLTEVNEFIEGEDLFDPRPARLSKGIRGTDIVATHVSLGTPDWAVITELPVAEAYEPIIQQYKITLLIVIANIILVILIASYISKRITKPIMLLNNAANEIGKGNFNPVIGVRSDDEIGQLASAFNTMTRELQKTTVSKDYVENIFKSMFDMLVVATPEGTIQTVNKAICDLLGYRSEELTGESIDKLIYDEVAYSATSYFNELAIKGSIINIEKYYLTKDGRKIPVLLSMSNMYDDKGNKLGVVCVGRDITERKHLEELNIENIRLEHQSKAKSEFLAAMSHELRTPLNAIIGFSDVMIAGIGGNLNETHKGYVKDIHKAGEHLLVIINDILDLSKVEADKMELVKEKLSVYELLEETITLIKNKAINHHIDIIRNIDPQLEFMDGDKQKIKQVLFNLLSNAVKFSKECGGTITVAVKKSDGLVSFSVSDTGIGIEKKNMNTLFKEFQQLDSGINRKYGGTGLGLMISRKFVELHGGKMIAESIYGEGSTFTFTIPFQQEIK